MQTMEYTDTAFASYIYFIQADAHRTKNTQTTEQQSVY